MRDPYGREINYMRVSITDRCNLRCLYCMPRDVSNIPHAQILKYEEILRFCGIMAKEGINTVKVTGGEPFVRKGAMSFLRELSGIRGIENVTVTTNGAALADKAAELSETGIKGLNLSLDAMENGLYSFITGGGRLEDALTTLEATLATGINVKINTVPVRGINEGSIIPVARLAERLPVYVRFIELMPKGAARGYEGIPNGEILEKLMGIWPGLEPDNRKHGFGPAVYYGSPSLTGGIGFISAMNGHFCRSCNRVRLTSDGNLKLCLYHKNALNIKEMLRGGASDREIAAAVLRAVAEKPEKHFFGDNCREDNREGMSKIGG